MRKIILLIVLTIIYSANHAQDKPPAKFGSISAEDLKKTVYSVDSNAAAVVLSDIGSVDIQSEGSWFNIIYKRHKRVHILKKSGYDAATISIPVYVSNRGDENIEDLKAVTYNFENGKVVESKLDMKNSIFSEKLTRNIHLKKFSLPNVKEGSIIEIEFKMISNSIYSLPSWEFQGPYPVLWSEYNASIPEFFYYLFIPQGHQNFYIKEKKETSRGFILDLTAIYLTPTKTSFSAAVDENRWVMRNVPALKEEGFTSTIRNHVSKIEFQLSAFRYPLNDRNMMLNWKEVTSELLKDEDIGQQITKDNSWLKSVVDSATRSYTTQTDKARSIFNYVRDNFTCTSYNQALPGNNLRDLFKTKRGSIATINFLLVAMLRRAGFTADPVMISTTPNGYPPVVYPVITKFNSLVCRTVLDGQQVFLDASHPLLGFGRLEWQCYNGAGRMINESATIVQLSPDSIFESQTVSVVLTKGEKGGLSGYTKKTAGYYESYKIRKQVKEKGKEEFFKELKGNFSTEISINNPEIDGLTQYDDNLQLSFDMQMDPGGQDLFYLNPMFGHGQSENPFKSPTRFYPVEMPYISDEVYILRLEVPEGYQLEELPKSGKLNYDDDGKSFFEYVISEKNGTIMLRSRIKITRTYFAPDEYEVLREFFAQIVNKHNEQIVFKKKK